jgi:hypothetical protein
MKNTTVHIQVRNNKVSISYNHSITLPDFITLMSTAILSAMQQTVASVPEAERERAKEEIYDMYNAAASNTLHYFAPEIDMRPHLTTQAILEAENAIIERMCQAEAQCPDVKTCGDCDTAPCEKTPEVNNVVTFPGK